MRSILALALTAFLLGLAVADAFAQPRTCTNTCNGSGNTRTCTRNCY